MIKKICIFFLLILISGCSSQTELIYSGSIHEGMSKLQLCRVTMNTTSFIEDPCMNGDPSLEKYYKNDKLEIWKNVDVWYVFKDVVTSFFLRHIIASFF